MPQNAMAATIAVNPSKQQTPLASDAQKGLLTVDSLNASLGLTAATQVKATAGRLVKVSVLVAGSAAGAAYDAVGATTGQFFVIPNTVGVYLINWPCANGVYVVPGTGQTISVSYN